MKWPFRLGTRRFESLPNLSARQDQAARFELRLRLVGGLVFALAAALILRLIYLQIEQFPHYQTLSEHNRIRAVPVAPRRGLILDRDGRLLARNRPRFSLALYPERVTHLEGLLDRLAQHLPLIDKQRGQIENRIAATPAHLPVTLLESLGTEQLARFAVHRHEFPSIQIRAHTARHYPAGRLTAHVVGYLGATRGQSLRKLAADYPPSGNRVGKAGIERRYETQLHGRPGSRQVETNAFGRVIRTLSTDPPQPGNKLTLTLDLELQRIVYKALASYRAASAVVIEPHTGAVLAMVSRPSFDPNQFTEGLPERTWKRLRRAPDNPLVNRAIQGLYPPGSTLKPVVALAGLARGAIQKGTTFHCDGTLEVGEDRHTFRCWLPRGHGSIAVKEAIIESCDIFFYRLGTQLGIEPLHQALGAFGFGQVTGVDLPGERAGLNPDPKWKRRHRHTGWYPGETVMTAIGQGYLQATPLQLAVMAATFANGGDRVQPYLVQAFEDPVTQETRHRQPGRHAIGLVQSADFHLIHRAMREVVHSVHGTAHPIAGGPVPIAGKTGTAQVVGLEEGTPGGRAPGERSHALFIGFAPYRTPQVAIAVVLEHSQGGGRLASEVARRILDSYLAD